MAKALRKRSTTKVDPRLAEVVVDNLDAIEDVRLLSSETKVGAATSSRLQLAIKYGAHAVRDDAHSARFIVRVAFDFQAADEGRAVDDPAIVIRAIMEVAYRLRGAAGIRDEHLQAFAQTNGVFNAWPYLREFVQSMTVRMGLPAFTIPVYRYGSTGMTGEVDLAEAKA